MTSIQDMITRTWVRKTDAKPRIVTSKADVCDALYGGLCPIETGAPYADSELPARRFQHSMSAEDMESIFSTSGVKPRSMLEIGSFWGDTAILAASQYNIPVTCIDTWLGGLAVWRRPQPKGFLYQGLEPRDAEDAAATGSQYKGEIPPASRFFRQFLSNVDRAGVADKVTCVRLPSASALRLFNLKGLQFEAIYVDGSHDLIDVYTDIVLSMSVAAPGAVVFGDDFNFADVAEAVTTYCRETGREYQTLETAKSKRTYWMIKPE